jgi:tetratricopeptide (TPR) repeat protein
MLCFIISQVPPNKIAKMTPTEKIKREAVCPKCRARLKYDPDKIVAGAVTFRCPGCTSVLRLRKNSGKVTFFSPPAAQKETRVGEKPERPEAETLELARKMKKAMEFVADDPPPEQERFEEQNAPAREPLPGEDEGPFIPADKLVTPGTPQESLLEDFDDDIFNKYEEAEVEPGDIEWLPFAAKKEPRLPADRIDVHEFPPAPAGLQKSLSSLRQAETCNLQGEAHLNNNLHEQAIRDFSRALEINPDYIVALLNRGNSYVQLGRYNDALADFNHALKFEKRNAELYSKRGAIFLQNNMFDEAIKDFTAALILNPMYAEAYLNRGRAYAEKGMAAEARLDFTQAIRADAKLSSCSFPDQTTREICDETKSEINKQKAAKCILQGLGDMNSGGYDEAVANFTKAITLAPSDAVSYTNRGQAYMKLGQPDKAVSDFNQAVLFDPLNPLLYFLRAQAWKAKDDPFNMTADLKVSCELGHEPACREYRQHNAGEK